MSRISVLILILSFASILCGCGSGGGAGSPAGGFYYPAGEPSSPSDLQPSPSIPEERISEVISGKNVFQPAGEETSIRVRMMTGPWTSQMPKTDTDKVLEKSADNQLLKDEIAHLLVTNEDDESAVTYGGDYYGLYDLTEMLYVIATQCSDDDIANAAADAFFNIFPEDGETIGAVVSAYNCGNIIPVYRYSYGISVFTTFNTTVMNFSEIKEDYMEHEFAKSSSWTDMIKALELI